MDAPPAPEELTERQAARRQRVLDAAIALATEGGYEAVQMRDVAARADVALGTVYRYFSSKDHLLAAAWSAWISPMEDRFARRPPRGDTMVERAMDVLARATRAFERDPHLIQALITSLVSNDPHAQKHVAEVGDVIDRLLGSVLDGIEPEERHRIVEVVGHVWYSALVQWVNGRMGIERVQDVLEMTCHVVLDRREPS